MGGEWMRLRAPAVNEVAIAPPQKTLKQSAEIILPSKNRGYIFE
jgi:hypothetical protein